MGLCPFHNEKTPSFHVNETEGFYHCFGCKASGDAIKFLQEHERLSFLDAVRQVARLAGMSVPEASPVDPQRKEEWDAVGSALALAQTHFREQFRGRAGTRARNYLASRDVSEETVEDFRLGFAPSNGGDLLKILAREKVPQAVQEKAGLVSRSDDGRAYCFFRERLMFPIRDRRGRVIAFGGRDLTGKARAKYLNSREGPLFHKSRTLFNLDQAIKAARKKGTGVRIVEGYMDVIALVEAGFPTAVAPLGTALTPDQMREVWRLDDEPVLCMDGDEAGKKAAMASVEKALPVLEPGKSLRFAFLPTGEDPDSLYREQGRNALEKVFEKARPLADLAWEAEFKRQPVDTPERRAHFQMRIEKLIGGINDGRVRESYRTFFAQKFTDEIGGQAFLSPEQARRGPPRKRFRDPGRVLDQVSVGRHKGRVNGTAERRERSLLQSVINVKGLIDHCMEALAQVPITSKVLDELRKEILDMHARNSPIDPESMRPCLERLGLSEDLTARAVNPGGWGARKVKEISTRADTALDRALKGWEETVKKQHEWHEEHVRRTLGRVSVPAVPVGDRPDKHDEVS